MKKLLVRAFDNWDKRFLYTDWNSFRNWYDAEKGGKVVFQRGKPYEQINMTEPELFTGLKDIAHINCFQNDIVKAVWSENINDEIFGIGKVIFNAGCFMIEWLDDREANMELLGLIYKTGRPRVFKIIGNVSQNPELLNR